MAALLEPHKKSVMMDEEEEGNLRKDVLISGLHALTSCFTYLP